MNDMFLVSGSELARRIRSGETTSVSLVDAAIDAVEDVNPRLNAMVATRYADARAEAKAADALLQEKGPDAVGPFHGVPCSIKECFALTGMPNTAGLASRVGQLAVSDATAVARMRAAGAIPLGVTNTSELCMWMESNNRVYGRTNNPYHLGRTVGGSSGGEGAIIGSGAVPFGLGSDVGGSIRMPSFFNGIFGHKPSSCLIPNTGQFPSTEGNALRYLTTGPMCRRAEDLWPLLLLMRGPDGLDTETREQTLGDPAEVRIADLRIFSAEGNHIRRVSEDLLDAQRRAGAALAAAGASFELIDLPEMRKSMDYWSVMLGSAPGPKFAEQLGMTRLPVLLKELGRVATRRSQHTLPAVVLAAIEGPMGGGRKNADAVIAAGEHFRDTINARLGANGVLLFPSYPSPAPKHYWPVARVIDWLYTAIFNVLELPVTQVPLGLNSEGLPLGVQVVAAHGNDHLTIAVAMELERRMGGWVPPAILGMRGTNAPAQ